MTRHDATPVRYRTAAATLSLPMLALAVGWLTPLDAVASAVVALPVVVLGAVLALDAGPPLRRFCRRTGVRPAVWAGAWLLVAAGFGAANWVGDPVALCPGPVPPRCITPYAWATVGFVGGAFALAIAAGNWPAYRRVTGTAIEGAGEVTPGPVALRGTVEPGGETVRSPVAGREAVCCRWAVAERAGGLSGDRWTTVETGEATARFYVSDATGRLLVDPEGGDLRPTVHRSAGSASPVDDSTVVESGESLPESVREFGAEHAASGAEDGAFGAEDGASGAFDGPADVDRQYQETRVEPHDPVFVVGEAVETRRVEYPERVVVAGGDGAALGLLLGAPGAVGMLVLAAG